MSSSRSIAAIASLPHTRLDGALGTGRSISLASAGLDGGMSTGSSLRGGGVSGQTRRDFAPRDKASISPMAGKNLFWRRKIAPPTQKSPFKTMHWIQFGRTTGSGIAEEL